MPDIIQHTGDLSNDSTAKQRIEDESVWRVHDCYECGGDGTLFTDGIDIWCDICDYIEPY